MLGVACRVWPVVCRLSLSVVVVVAVVLVVAVAVAVAVVAAVFGFISGSAQKRRLRSMRIKAGNMASDRAAELTEPEFASETRLRKARRNSSRCVWARAHGEEFTVCRVARKPFAKSHVVNASSVHEQHALSCNPPGA